MPNIQIDKIDWQILQQILSKYPYQFYAYGSRAKGTVKKFSDLDLCYFDNIPDNLIFEIKDNFTQSNLPFFVEVAAWKNMHPAFREIIKKDLILISSPTLTKPSKL